MTVELTPRQAALLKAATRHLRTRIGRAELSLSDVPNFAAIHLPTDANVTYGELVDLSNLLTRALLYEEAAR